MSAPFRTCREAALALLEQCPDLSRKMAGLLGHLCVDDPNEKQIACLREVLARKGFPPLAI